MVEVKHLIKKKEYPSKGLWEVQSKPINFGYRKWLF